MLKTLLSESESQECTALLKPSGTKSESNLYSALSAADRLISISVDAQCVLASGYRLVRVDGRMGRNGDAFEIALLNDVEASVVYYNMVKVAFIPESSPRGVSQSLVWRSTDARHATLVRDVAHNVFFNYIVERYDIILSDNQKIGGGRFFLQRQVSRSIAYGLCVFYLTSDGGLQWLPTQGALNNLVDQLWSGADEQHDYLVLISKARRATERLNFRSEQREQYNQAPGVSTEGVTVLDTHVVYGLLDNPLEPTPELCAMVALR